MFFFETNTILFREILNLRDTSMFSHNHNISKKKKIEANFLNRVLSQKFSYYHLLSNKALTESLDIFNFIIWESFENTECLRFQAFILNRPRIFTFFLEKKIGQIPNVFTHRYRLYTFQKYVSCLCLMKKPSETLQNLLTIRKDINS